jgi:hypothetical protein
MGYSRCFPGLTATPEVIDDARKIIEASPVTICGPKGQGLPILNEAEGIRLNGFRAAGEACGAVLRLQRQKVRRAVPYPTACSPQAWAATAPIYLVAA